MSSLHMFTTSLVVLFFFFNDPAPTEIYTLSLHDALPISRASPGFEKNKLRNSRGLPHLRTTGCSYTINLASRQSRSEEHTSELQSHSDLVCRLLLEKKKKLQSQGLTATHETASTSNSLRE